ncbi:M20 family metallopeptidase [Streptomyces sp. ME19-01-6]|uniref:M20 family metallopeptidase n=1 Tax=Streptomyces sp. ME19-01-6 TaxID=3028686 RepID=UPI0029AEB72A|nr:M20 family metallopeptidase [Streptomyces sp. ME19-01-6]MDX3231409.1 M20 family metallopeptidase [Streptomyces sp. ME19-01-6]
MTAEVRRRPPAAALLALAGDREPGFVNDLAELVGIDSGSNSPAGVNRVADWVGDRLTTLGFTVERVALPATADGQRVGDVLVARKAGALSAAQGGRRVLLAAHMDTVFEDGTAALRPFTIRAGLAHGPGVCDDKGGLLAGLTALDVLAEAGVDAYRELVFLATPDEEIGSPASRPVTERIARKSDVALALECARENGDLVCARKGVADFRVTVTGRAAHAGIEPERGANAALAAAHLVVALQGLNGRWDGVTVNVGVVRAGTRANIVCPEAELRVEVRSATASGIDAARDAIETAASQPGVAGTSAHVEQLDFCPPMEHTPAARRLLATACELGTELGLSVRATATGGVGDANLIAGAGIPVLDGLGPVGGADHSPEEWLDLSSVHRRVALLASLIAVVGDGRT